MVAEKQLTVVAEMNKQDINIINRMAKDDSFEDYLVMLGCGQFGRVYLYKSLDGKEYAIKVIKSHERNNSSSSQDLERLLDLQGLPSIPKLYAYIKNYVFVSERVKGECVIKIEDDDDYILNKLHKNFYGSLMKAVVEIRKRGYYAKDIHNENIMVNEHGLPVIVDVGHFEKISLETSNYFIRDYFRDRIIERYLQERYARLAKRKNTLKNRQEKLSKLLVAN